MDILFIMHLQLSSTYLFLFFVDYTLLFIRTSKIFQIYQMEKKVNNIVGEVIAKGFDAVYNCSASQSKRSFRRKRKRLQLSLQVMIFLNFKLVLYSVNVI